MTTWAEGTTRGERKAKADALEHANYQCQIRLKGCTRHAATAVMNGEALQSACPHCIEQSDTSPPAESKRQRRPRKQTPKRG